MSSENKNEDVRNQSTCSHLPAKPAKATNIRSHPNYPSTSFPKATKLIFLSPILGKKLSSGVQSSQDIGVGSSSQETLLSELEAFLVSGMHRIVASWRCGVDGVVLEGMTLVSILSQ